MRIQISKDLDKDEISKQLQTAKIVENGDYILIPKNRKISVYDVEGVVFIDVNEIDYIESLNNTIYVRCGTIEYISRLKLYEYLEEAEFLIRISKAVVVNINKIAEIRPSLNMKFKILVGNKWLEVNRSYYYDFKDKIGI